MCCWAVCWRERNEHEHHEFYQLSQHARRDWGFGLYHPLVPLTLSFHSPNEVYRAICAGLCTREVDSADGKGHIAILSTARVIVVGSGVAGTLIGFILMLTHIKDLTHVGPAMALALLCVFYVVVLSELILAPMINRLRARTSINSDASDAPAGPSGVLNVAAILGSLWALSGLVAAMPDFAA